MTSLYLVYPQVLTLYAAVGIAAGLFFYARRKRRISLAVFGAHTRPVRNRGLKAGLLLSSASLLVLAAARPRIHGTSAAITSGRDIVFMLDVSRSMLAPDLPPSRLERARQAITDLLPSLEGARVGLVAFAGDGEVLCPLTNDMQFFRTALAQASPDSVAAPGTHLATSLREALNDSFDDLGGRSRYLVLITDGEDHGRFNSAPARSARRLGIDLIVAGVGDSGRGSRIPVGTHFVSWQGREVWSRLEPAPLRAMASAAGGAYIAVGTEAARFSEIRSQLTKAAAARVGEEWTGAQELYRWPLIAAFLMLCAEALIRERTRP